MEYISNKTCASCQGHCKDGSPCKKSTGRCDNGCQNHWMGEFCEGKNIFFYFILYYLTFIAILIASLFICTIL